MREKLREVVKDAAWNYHDEEWRDGTADMFVDAVLDALMEPTPDMMSEGVEPFLTENVRDSSVNGKCGRVFVRMIQAAKDGK